jgi:hypothetical protein
VVFVGSSNLGAAIVVKEEHNPRSLSAVVRLSGGVRAVARIAGVDASNLSRSLTGRGGLSQEKLERIISVLGRLDGQADRSRVVVLNAKRANEDVACALRWFFPGGAQVARAAWSAMTVARIRKFLRGGLAPEIYALSDGQARIALLFPAGPMLPRELFPECFPTLRWWEDSLDRAILDIEDPIPWASGTITPPEFDAAWPGRGYNPTVNDLLAEVHNLRISYAEAIRRIHRGAARQIIVEDG